MRLLRSFCLFSILERPEEREQRGAIAVGCAFVSPPRQFRLGPVTTDRVLEGRSRSIVQVGPAEAKTPECRRTNLLRCRHALRDAIARPNVVQQEVREEWDLAVMEERIAARPGLQRRCVACGAADCTEHLFAEP